LEAFFAGGTESRDSTLGSPTERAHNRTAAEHTLRGTTLRVAARMPSFQVSMRDLLSLRAGSVLATGVQRSAELQVLVGSQRRFSATPGRVGASLAVRITDGLHAAPELDVISLLRE
jgi:flagellar motor switch protein FliM